MDKFVVFDALTFLKAASYDPDEEEPKEYEKAYKALELLKENCPNRLLFTSEVEELYQDYLRRFPRSLLESVLTELRGVTKIVGSGNEVREDLPQLRIRYHQKFFEEVMHLGANLIIADPESRWFGNRNLREALATCGIILLTPDLYKG